MTTTDLSLLTWEAIQPLLRGRRLRVLETWRTHGRGTTQQMAARAGISILTFRPRTTELLQLGLLTLVDHAGTEGIYEAVPAEMAREAFEAARRAAAPDGHQTLMKI